jgi:hypothetical protein
MPNQSVSSRCCCRCGVRPRRRWSRRANHSRITRAQLAKADARMVIPIQAGFAGARYYACVQNAKATTAASQINQLRRPRIAGSHSLRATWCAERMNSDGEDGSERLWNGCMWHLRFDGRVSSTQAHIMLAQIALLNRRRRCLDQLGYYKDLVKICCGNRQIFSMLCVRRAYQRYLLCLGAKTISNPWLGDNILRLSWIVLDLPAKLIDEHAQFGRVLLLVESPHFL